MEHAVSLNKAFDYQQPLFLPYALETSLGFGIIYDQSTAQFIVNPSDYVPQEQFDASLNQIIIQSSSEFLPEASLGPQFYWQDGSLYVTDSSSVTAEWGFITGDINTQTDLQTQRTSDRLYLDGSLALRDASISDLYSQVIDLETSIGILDQNKLNHIAWDGQGTNIIQHSGLGTNYAVLKGIDASDNITITSDGSTIYIAATDTSSGDWKTYVDGSLASRDASIDKLFQQNLDQDTSIINLDLLAQIHEVSLGNLTSQNITQDASIDLINSTYFPEASLGFGLFYQDGVIDVSLADAQGVSQAYVDGSLALRDASIDKLFEQNINQDVSISDLDVFTQLHETSLGNLTQWNLSQDVSIDLINSTYFPEASLGSGLFYQGGVIDVSIDSVSQSYVDGSLTSRDVSININLLGVNEVSTRVNLVEDISAGVGLYSYAKTLANGTLEASLGMSVSKGGTGVYNYTLDNPQANNFYGIIAQPYSTITDTNAQISNVTTSGFTVSIGQGDNGTTPDVLTDTEHSVIVFGPPTEMGLGVSRAYVDGSLGERDDKFFPEASFGFGLFYQNGVWDVSVEAGGGVSFEYVDGSLAARDASIDKLFQQNIDQDTSINNNALSIQIIDGSITFLDSSVNQLFDSLGDIDASLDLYVLKAGDVMTGPLETTALTATGDVSVIGGIYLGDVSSGPSDQTDLLAVVTESGKIVATEVPAGNVTTEVIDVSSDIDVSILRGFYYVDTTGGTVNVTIPDVSISNDGFLFSIIKKTPDLNPVIVTTQSGVQNIGSLTEQTILQPDKGFTVVGDFDNDKWLISQDSRYLEGQTQGEFQYWDVSARNWLPTTSDITWDNDALRFVVGGNSTPPTFQVDASRDIVYLNSQDISGLVPGDDLAFLSGGRGAFGNSVTIDRLRNNVPGNVPRALSLIDTTATLRIWRYVDDSNDPAMEFVWGLQDAPSDPSNNWWDMFLDGANDGTDSFAIRRRTGGADNKIITAFNDKIEFTEDTSITGSLRVSEVSLENDPSTKDTKNVLIDVSSGNKLVAGGYYGQEFQLAESLSLSSTTSNSPQTKLTLTTTDLPAGKYKIDVGWIGRKSNQSNDMIFDVTLNGTAQGTEDEMNIEVKDSTSRNPYRRVFYLDLSGVNTIALRYWRESTGTTFISDATIELIRVS